MSLLLALALIQTAASTPVPTTATPTATVPATAVPTTAAPDARRALSLWIGGGDRLSFAFGRALSQALAASSTVRQAVPIGAAEYRMVLRQIRPPREPAGRFAYAVDLLQPRETRHGRPRERIVRTVRGRCDATTLDACAGEITNNVSSRLGS